jgi:cytochrome oxidase Cu insertion factor (SCO1/SenC/PrrC family)
MWAAPGRSFVLSLLGILAALALAGCSAGADASYDDSSSTVYQGTKLEGPAADFQLVDQQGAEVALPNFRGKVVVLAFLDPQCTDVCPLTANEFRLTAEALGNDAAQVAFLVVNVNPAANSVAQVSVATVRWGVQDLQGWHFLTGSREELEPVYRAYHIEAEGPPKPGKADELQHTPGVYIIDQDGNLGWYISTPLIEEGLVAPWPGPRLGETLAGRIRELLPS